MPVTMKLAVMLIMLLHSLPVTKEKTTVTSCETQKGVVEGESAWLQFRLSGNSVQSFVYVLKRESPLAEDNDFEFVFESEWNDTKNDIDNIILTPAKDGGKYLFGGIHGSVLTLVIPSASLQQTGYYEAEDSRTNSRSSRLTCQLIVMPTPSTREAGPTTERMKTSTASVEGTTTTEQISDTCTRLINAVVSLSLLCCALLPPALYGAYVFRYRKAQRDGPTKKEEDESDDPQINSSGNSVGHPPERGIPTRDHVGDPLGIGIHARDPPKDRDDTRVNPEHTGHARDPPEEDQRLAATSSLACDEVYDVDCGQKKGPPLSLTTLSYNHRMVSVATTAEVEAARPAASPVTEDDSVQELNQSVPLLGSEGGERQGERSSGRSSNLAPGHNLQNI